MPQEAARQNLPSNPPSGILIARGLVVESIGKWLPPLIPFCEKGPNRMKRNVECTSGCALAIGEIALGLYIAAACADDEYTAIKLCGLVVNIIHTDLTPKELATRARHLLDEKREEFNNEDEDEIAYIFRNSLFVGS